MQIKKYPKYLNDFVIKFQIDLANAANRVGPCLQNGHLMISNQIAKYMIRKFKMTRRMKKIDLVRFLDLDEEIKKRITDTEPAKITNLRVKLGNRLICTYATSVEIRLQDPFSYFYWEFEREMMMDESGEEEIKKKHRRLVNDVNSN